MSHQTISFIKSAIRIGGYLALLVSLELSVSLLVLSEFLGILEEVGER